MIPDAPDWQSLPPAQQRHQPEALLPYAVPERGAPGHTRCVLLPASADEVASVLREAQASGRALVLSAGRTGLVEAQRPEGETVLSLEKLKRILSIDPAGQCAEVEAAVPVDTLNVALAEHGLVWPMEMGSTSAATVGACVANGSAGANAVCYGTAAHLCETAYGLWADGSETGAQAGPHWLAPAPQVLAIDSAAPDIQQGLIGTQGVLGVITRLRLRLHKLPAQREAALIPVADMPAAMRVLALARDVFGSDVEEFEFISASAMALVRAMQGESFRWPYLRDPGAAFHLLLQVKSDDAGEELAAHLYQFLTETLQQPDDALGYAPLKVLKRIRHSITEASNHAMKSLGGGRLAFDTATPVEVFGDYLAALEATLKTQHPQVQLVAFGHAGVGGAHLHLLGTAAQPVKTRAEALVKLVFDVTARHRGTFSAEHGVGSKWGAAFAERAHPQVVAELIAAKRYRDPAHILNPRSFGLDQLVRRA
ncbi:MAG: FAD-binding oxidoreductase [Pseudomonadota bacterium]